MSRRRVSLTKLGDTPMKDQFPPEKHNRIIKAYLKNVAIDVSATDWIASPVFDPIRGNMFDIFVTRKTYDELKAVFDKLAGEAVKKRFQELHGMPFGVYGQFYDKYGVQWIFRRVDIQERENRIEAFFRGPLFFWPSIKVKRV
jgi:PhnB protein